MSNLRKGTSNTNRFSRFVNRRNNTTPKKATDFSILEAVEESPKEEASPGSKEQDNERPKDSSAPSPPSTTATRDSTEPEAANKDTEDDDGWETVKPKEKNFDQTLRPVVNTQVPAYRPPFAQAVPYAPSHARSSAANWRSRANQGSNYQPPGYEQPSRRGSTTRGGPGHVASAGIDASKINPGAILYHYEVVRRYDDAQAAAEGAKEDGLYVFQTKSGDWYIEKGRFYFVTSRMAQHWNESAIYTYKGTGLANKPDAVKKEHVGLKPLHISAKDYKKQNEYDPVEVKVMKDLNEKLSEKSVIHFTEQRSSNFNTNIRIVAYADGEA